jgi:phosphatidylserine/phosphatidylglycerophosphate/cardiolipin synthase-like enzyme
MSLLGIVLSLYIIRREENPAYKLAWLLLFGIVPLFGVLVYALLGNKHLSRRLRRKLEKVESEHRPVANERVTDALPPRFAATCRYLTRYGSYPAYAGTDVRYFALGDELFPALLADLERAEHYIFLEYFIIAEGNMLDAIMDVLYRKAAAGLDVRIIYDDIKNGKTPDVDAFLAVSERLRAMGADALILGCTELSLIKKHYRLPPYFIDSLDVLAASTIEACGKTPIGFDFTLDTTRCGA